MRKLDEARFNASEGIKKLDNIIGTPYENSLDSLRGARYWLLHAAREITERMDEIQKEKPQS